MIKFDVLNRWSQNVQFTAEIDCKKGELNSIKLSLAVKWALKNKVDLRGANLRGANLRDANLRDANLSDANLSDANLSYANLRDANLSYANLRDANLSDANLRDANLSYANLSDANLSYANLRDANLSDANLRGAKGADYAIARTRILPEGSLIGWKKCLYGVIVKLRIPEEAKRSHAFGRKCRAEFAEVVEIIGADTAKSSHDPGFTYEVGKRVEPDSWCDDWQDECSNGIHFFITKREAEDY
jgi:hypothetical protein